MQTENPDITVQIVVISTMLLLFLGGCIIYFLLYYQRKRFRHAAEMKDLKDSIDKMLMQSKLEIQEQTLDHIAKEIHSNILQIASYLNVNLQSLEQQTKGEVLKEVMETRSYHHQLMAELKALNISFNTDVIMKMGLEDALEKELGRIKKLKHHLEIKKGSDHFRLPPEKEIVIFRLCQEVFNNTMKHAKAKSLAVTLRYHAQGLELTITDDGTGFDIQAIDNISGSSSGLLNMRKRTKFLGGNFDIISAVDEGTTVKIRIPKESLNQTTSIS